MTTSTTAQIATSDVTIIRNVRPQAMAEAHKLWREMNDEGRGFNPDLDDELEGHLGEYSGDVLLVLDGARLLAIAWVHGPWAVDVTGKIEL